MHTVTIHWGEETREVRTAEGTDLLRLLEEEQVIISAPCQGKGRCGKPHLPILFKGYRISIQFCS